MLSVVALALLVGCEAEPLTTTDVNKDKVVEEVDEEAPVILHDPVSTTQTFGSDVAIQATVTDNDAVVYVILHYKNEVDGSADWEKDDMTPSGDVYSGTIDGNDHRGGGVDYYIEAVDRSQNRAYAPDGGESDPYHFRIAE
ncbi:MAG: hypothetical protein Q8P18_10230 [Pseudomonadota bacterium]|nr:hypothetical protein [Pseudomonadota bacterium]